MDSTAYYAIGIPLYIVLFGVESGSILIVAAIAGIGGLLDHRRAVCTFEAVRLAVFVPAAAGLLVWSWS